MRGTSAPENSPCPPGRPHIASTLQRSARLPARASAALRFSGTSAAARRRRDRNRRPEHKNSAGLGLLLSSKWHPTEQ
uniref:Uncharacterized protein n=1 Tax=Oryza barthii TaxID=65489 RepID=A0A0D3H532_9ORYZ